MYIILDGASHHWSWGEEEGVGKSSNGGGRDRGRPMTKIIHALISSLIEDSNTIDFSSR